MTDDLFVGAYIAYRDGLIARDLLGRMVEDLAFGQDGFAMARRVAQFPNMTTS